MDRLRESDQTNWKRLQTGTTPLDKDSNKMPHLVAGAFVFVLLAVFCNADCCSPPMRRCNSECKGCYHLPYEGIQERILFRSYSFPENVGCCDGFVELCLDLNPAVGGYCGVGEASLLAWPGCGFIECRKNPRSLEDYREKGRKLLNVSTTTGEFSSTPSPQVTGLSPEVIEALGPSRNISQWCAAQTQKEFGVGGLSTKEQIKAFFDCMDTDKDGGLDADDEVIQLAKKDSSEFAEDVRKADADGDDIVELEEMDPIMRTSEPTSSGISLLRSGSAFAVCIIGSFIILCGSCPVG